MIPLGLPYGSRNKRLAKYTESLTSFDIPTSQALHFLNPNIMKGATDRFMGEDANESSLRIFLDL